MSNLHCIVIISRYYIKSNTEGQILLITHTPHSFLSYKQYIFLHNIKKLSFSCFCFIIIVAETADKKLKVTYGRSFSIIKY